MEIEKSINENKKQYKISIELAENDKFYLDHIIDGNVISPASCFIYSIWNILADEANRYIEEVDISIQNFKIRKPLFLEKNNSIVN